MRWRIGTITVAAVLFLAGAIGLFGDWALGTSVVLLVATSVGTAIAWEERDVRPQAFAAEDLLVRVPLEQG